jgi:distribution and morphology protein 10
VPSGTLDGLYSTRIGPSTQLAIALRSELSASRKTKKGDYPDDSHIAFSLQHDRGRLGTELTYNAKNGIWGGQILYNFGRGTGEDKGEIATLPAKRVDEDDAVNGGLKGRLSAGAEVLFSLRDKSGGSELPRIGAHRNC